MGIRNDGAGENECRKTQGKIRGPNSQRNYRPVELPTQPLIHHRVDVLPNKVVRLKALGNAVVPQIPELIGRAIMAIEA